LQLPVVATKADLARPTERIVDMVGKARRKSPPPLDLVVFPEYSLHGLSMDTNPEIMCRLDGPEVAAFKKACIETSLGLLLDHGAKCLCKSLQFRPDHRRSRRDQALLS